MDGSVLSERKSLAKRLKETTVLLRSTASNMKQVLTSSTFDHCDGQMEEEGSSKQSLMQEMDALTEELTKLQTELHKYKKGSSHCEEEMKGNHNISCQTEWSTGLEHTSISDTRAWKLLKGKLRGMQRNCKLYRIKLKEMEDVHFAAESTFRGKIETCMEERQQIRKEMGGLRISYEAAQAQIRELQSGLQILQQATPDELSQAFIEAVEDKSILQHDLQNARSALEAEQEARNKMTQQNAEQRQLDLECSLAMKFQTCALKHVNRRLKIRLLETLCLIDKSVSVEELYTLLEEQRQMQRTHEQELSEQAALYRRCHEALLIARDAAQYWMDKCFEISAMNRHKPVEEIPSAPSLNEATSGLQPSLTQEELEMNFKKASWDLQKEQRMQKELEAQLKMSEAHIQQLNNQLLEKAQHLNAAEDRCSQMEAQLLQWNPHSQSQLLAILHEYETELEKHELHNAELEKQLTTCHVNAAPASGDLLQFHNSNASALEESQQQETAKTDYASFEIGKMEQELQWTKQKMLMFQEAHKAASQQIRDLLRQLVSTEKVKGDLEDRLLTSAQMKPHAVSSQKADAQSWQEVFAKTALNHLSYENSQLFDQLHKIACIQMKEESAQKNDVKAENKYSRGCNHRRMESDWRLNSANEQIAFLEDKVNKLQSTLTQMEDSMIYAQQHFEQKLERSEERRISAEMQLVEKQEYDKGETNTRFYQSLLLSLDLNLDQRHTSEEETNRCALLKQIDLVRDLKLQIEEMRHRCQETERALEEEVRKNKILEDELNQMENRTREKEALGLTHHSDQQRQHSETILLDEMKLLLSIKDAKISDLKRSADVKAASDIPSQLDSVKVEKETESQVLLAQEEELACCKKSLEEREQEIESLKQVYEQELERCNVETEALRTALDNAIRESKTSAVQRRKQLASKNTKIRQLQGVMKGIEQPLKKAGREIGSWSIRSKGSKTEQYKHQENVQNIQKKNNQAEVELHMLQSQMTDAEIGTKRKNTGRIDMKEKLEPELSENSQLKRQVNKLRNRWTSTGNAQVHAANVLYSKILCYASKIEKEEKVGIIDKSLIATKREMQSKREYSSIHGYPSSLSKVCAAQQKLQQLIQGVAQIADSHREWEEKKKLQKRIETLRTNLNTKSQELMQLKSKEEVTKKETEDLQTEVSRLHELANVQQLEVKKLKTELRAAPDRTHVAELLNRLTELEKERNEFEVINQKLTRQSDLRNKKEPVPDYDKEDWEAQYWKKEEEAFEYRLRKEQAEAQIQRLRQSLKELFKEDGTREQHPSTLMANQKQTKHSLAAADREEELMITIRTLTKALKRARSGVSLKQYNQVIKQKKELQKKFKALPTATMQSSKATGDRHASAAQIKN